MSLIISGTLDLVSSKIRMFGDNKKDWCVKEGDVVASPACSLP